MRSLVVLCLAGLLATLAVIRGRRLARIFRDFWNEPGSPYNLAIFRIVLFATFLFSVDLPATIWYSRMPTQLRFPMCGLQGILPHVPANPQLARLTASLLLVACFLAAIGLATRWCAALATLLGLYVLGLPHSYGKVNHLHHHLIWFSALMIASPCADVLSLDAILRARRRPGVPPPADALAYMLPLKFVWLLLGVIYFIPGCWKVWYAGLSWTGAENIRLQLYAKWSEFGAWTPFFRIDQHPLLCAVLGLATVIFEISFLPLVFFPRCRPWLALFGLAFHNFTGLFMRIWFGPLQAMYVSLVNWPAVYRFFPRSDHVLRGTPFPRSEIASANPLVPIISVGSVLLLANICFGAAGISSGWPFACYPTFASRVGPARDVMTVTVEKQNGEVIELDRTALSHYLPSDRERGLEESLLRISNPTKRETRLRAFWELWRQNHPELNGTCTIRFYRDTLSTLPGATLRPLRRESLLAQLTE